jgi:carboxymethylenebutenolidase
MTTDTIDATDAGSVTQRAVDVPMPDGVCDAVLLGCGRPAPAVIWYPDGYGQRQTHIDMARRLAGHGYAVLVINPYYRVRRAPVLPPDFNFYDPACREEGMRLIGMLDHDAVTRDATAYVAFLDGQPEVNKQARVGAVGFCLGGAMTVRTAAAVPGRVGACASFHGGSLVTDAANSPHRLVAKTGAAFHIAIATDDDEKQPDAKTEMAAALEKAQRPMTQEVYPGAKHGWMVPDRPVHNPEQAERGWAAMLRLYQQALV